VMNQDLLLKTAGFRRIVYGVLGSFNVLFGSTPKVIVLTYHSIADEGTRFSVKPSEFKKQMEYLLTSFKPIKLSDLKQYLNRNYAVEQPSFVVTFDDGYKDILSVADFLSEKKIYPTVFMVAKPEQVDRTQLMNEKELLSDEEVLKLHGLGWEIGAHSTTHADLRKLGGPELLAETKGAKEILEQRLQIPINYFSYPKGYHNPAIIEAVKSGGYDLAVSMDDFALQPDTNKFTIPRIGVDGSHSFSEFKVLFSNTAIRIRKLIKAAFAN
jgi:poly-beta-1,6-N-acetyl-D-glucosamine N-deacetylase